jgi:hypothetical protein
MTASTMDLKDLLEKTADPYPSGGGRLAANNSSP